jgi:aspartokinase-like uncharacterized kinase
MPEPESLTLIKVGGSLLDWPELPHRLRSFVDDELGHDGRGRIALVVGGGGAADFIRAMDRIQGLGDDAAHRLAIHSLDLSARLLHALLPGSCVVAIPEELRAAWGHRELPILSPRLFLEQLDDPHADRLPASWDVTTDSIAARIASRLGSSRLVLLKSAVLPQGTDRESAARLGLVDPPFPDVARSLERVEWVAVREDPLVYRPLPP